VEFRPPANRAAVLIGESAADQPATACDFEILTVPSANVEDPELFTPVQAWVEEVSPANSKAIIIMLHGALILWNPGRAAIIAHADRIETLQKSLLEVSYYEAELRQVEAGIAAGWTTLETDAPHAFEFQAKSLPHRKQLADQYQRVVSLRVRLSRITPAIQAPHLYPPTLASQIDERLRERARMPQRQEFVHEQLAIFENFYEVCGQRASDFLQARTGHRLEWAIIILLVIQTIMLVYELLTNLSAASSGL
jgi:hypothetical protein